MEESATAIEVQSRWTSTLTYLEIVGTVGPFCSSTQSVARTRAENSRMSWETAGLFHSIDWIRPPNETANPQFLTADVNTAASERIVFQAFWWGDQTDNDGAATSVGKKTPAKDCMGVDSTL